MHAFVKTMLGDKRLVLERKCSSVQRIHFLPLIIMGEKFTGYIYMVFSKRTINRTFWDELVWEYFLNRLTVKLNATCFCFFVLFLIQDWKKVLSHLAPPYKYFSWSHSLNVTTFLNFFAKMYFIMIEWHYFKEFEKLTWSVQKMNWIPNKVIAFKTHIYLIDEGGMTFIVHRSYNS